MKSKVRKEEKFAELTEEMLMTVQGGGSENNDLTTTIKNFLIKLFGIESTNNAD